VLPTLFTNFSVVLTEIILSDQFAFFPERFILDNILLTHEILDWAKHLGQALFFLKLDFSKAFNMVDHGFLRKVMTTMGFLEHFVAMTMLLFQDAKASMKVNGLHSQESGI